ncbi:MAG: hypothetical protein IKI37_03450 [Oscillospiraceae bacterium]|nr:hypothetical protein [Oscillospiraceae bacterium]MBR7084217.1 hypothetical protein [Oscillospiraceae bacterium]
MDLRKNALEIGHFEIGRNLAAVASSEEVREKLGQSMPLPPSEMNTVIDKAAKWLLDFHKKKYMFLMPEIALIEAMAQKTSGECEIIVVLPCSTEAEVKERICHNLPHGIKIQILEEPYFPDRFFPQNALLVVTGYLGMHHAMVLPEVYRMAEHYGGFLGKKVFLPYVSLSCAARYDSWIEMKNDYFKEYWRDEYDNHNS